MLLARANAEASVAAESGPPPRPRSGFEHDLEAGDVIDGFRVVRVLARSGMGSVLKVHQEGSAAPIVLKVPHMRFECDVVYYSRFLREEKIGLRLRHPAIARAFECPDKSRPYLAMEFVDGVSLYHRLSTEGPMPSSEAFRVGRRLCEALVYMHAEGVVHRDLKPENVLIDAQGEVRLVDFGVALDKSDRRLTWNGFSSRLGTPEYMAPEQVRGRRGDGRVDVYALGALLYELLSGARPYPARNVAAALRSKLRTDARPLAEVAPHVDPGLAAIVMRALERDPARRFASAAEMLAALVDPSQPLAPVRAAGRRGSAPLAMALGVACVFLLAVTAMLVPLFSGGHRP
jgi:serine/threonine-protein kinase